MDKPKNAANEIFSKTVLGIDLGTANSCVSIIDENSQTIIIPDQDGHLTQPSIFAFSSEQNILVGRAAKEKSETNRLNTIFAIKRLIGRKFSSSYIREAQKKLPYKIIESKNGDAWVDVNDKHLSPEEISAHILKHMKEIAEKHLNEKINKAVITVPAHFNDSQRQATRDAGEIAGLKVLSMINEPTAAALAYGLDSNENEGKKNIAVFDLGGGTFDITILKQVQSNFSVLSTNGDTYLGGEDFDLTLVDYLTDLFEREEKIDLRSDKQALERIKSAAKKAKHELSDEVKTLIEIPNIAAGNVGGELSKNLSYELNRKELSKIFSHLIAALKGPCIEALEDANLKNNKVDEVILVGGMTRMPLVKKCCEKIFGVKPIDTVNPDTAVASGAAIKAALIQGDLQGVSLEDVTSLAFGIEVAGGKVVKMIDKNTKIPCISQKLFSTSRLNQQNLNIHVLQGDSPYSSENKSLGLFSLTNISPVARGIPNIEISLEVDADNIVKVKAKDLDSEEVKNIEIVPTSGLQKEELSQLKKESVQFDAEEKRRKDKSLLREASLNKEGLNDAETESNKALTQEQILRKKLRENSDDKETKAIINSREKLKALIFALQFKLDMEGISYRGEKREELDEMLKLARDKLKDSASLAGVLAKIIQLETLAEDFEAFLDS